MPTHKISLTSNGFKTISTDFIIDSLVSFLLFCITIFSLYQNPQYLLLFGVLILGSTIVYLFFRARNGYLYPLGYFYQIMLFWVITPPVFINWQTIPFICIILFLFHYKSNPFKTIYFPMSIYLCLIVSSVVLIFGKSSLYMNILNISQNQGYLFLTNYEVSGYFFRINESLTGSYSNISFSIIEKFSFLSPLLIGTIALRQKNIFIDFLLIIGMVLLSYFFFGQNIEFLQDRCAVLVCIWYLIFSAPGKNKGFSLNYSLFSLFLTGIFSFLLIKESMGFPPIMLPISFFFIQSILYIITQDPNFYKVPLSKRVFSK